MKLASESKFLLGILLATVAIIGLAAILLSRPAKPLTKDTLIPTDAHTAGGPNSTVWLVEFSDFQCAACRTFQPIVNQLIKDHGDRIFFAYRHFPLSSHPFAAPAARAAEAAAKQGKFWEAVDVLFANQGKFSDAFFSSQFAQLLQLDQSQFDKDFASAAVAERVADDEAAARALNLPGTPTFFLNGVRLNLTSPADLEKAVIDLLKSLK